MPRFGIFAVFVFLAACGPKPSAPAQSGQRSDSKLEIVLHDQGKREVVGPAFARYHEDQKTLEVFVAAADSDPAPSCDTIETQNPSSPPKKLAMIALSAASFAGKPGAYDVASSSYVNVGGSGGLEVLADSLSATKMTVGAFDDKSFSAEITSTADEGSAHAQGTVAGIVCSTHAEAKVEAPSAPAPSASAAPPPEPPAPPPPPHPDQPNNASVEQIDATVCFARGAATLDAKGSEQAKALAKLLSDRMHRNPQVVRIAIDGRVSSDENAKDPAKLSAARAQVVAARLAKGGVPKAKIVAHGRGVSASYYASPPFNPPKDERGPCVDVIAFVSP